MAQPPDNLSKVLKHLPATHWLKQSFDAKRPSFNPNYVPAANNVADIPKGLDLYGPPIPANFQRPPQQPDPGIPDFSPNFGGGGIANRFFGGLSSASREGAEQWGAFEDAHLSPEAKARRRRGQILRALESSKELERMAGRTETAGLSLSNPYKLLARAIQQPGQFPDRTNPMGNPFTRIINGQEVRDPIPERDSRTENVIAWVNRAADDAERIARGFAVQTHFPIEAWYGMTKEQALKTDIFGVEELDNQLREIAMSAEGAGSEGWKVSLINMAVLMENWLPESVGGEQEGDYRRAQSVLTTLMGDPKDKGITVDGEEMIDAIMKGDWDRASSFVKYHVASMALPALAQIWAFTAGGGVGAVIGTAFKGGGKIWQALSKMVPKFVKRGGSTKIGGTLGAYGMNYGLREESARQDFHQERGGPGPNTPGEEALISAAAAGGAALDTVFVAGVSPTRAANVMSRGIFQRFTKRLSEMAEYVSKGQTDRATELFRRVMQNDRWGIQVLNGLGRIGEGIATEAVTESAGELASQMVIAFATDTPFAEDDMKEVITEAMAAGFIGGMGGSIGGRARVRNPSDRARTKVAEDYAQPVREDIAKHVKNLDQKVDTPDASPVNSLRRAFDEFENIRQQLKDATNGRVDTLNTDADGSPVPLPEIDGKKFATYQGWLEAAEKSRKEKLSLIHI